MDIPDVPCEEALGPTHGLCNKRAAYTCDKKGCNKRLCSSHRSRRSNKFDLCIEHAEAAEQEAQKAGEAYVNL